MSLEGGKEYVIRGKVSSCNQADTIFSPDLPNLMRRGIYAASSIVRCNEEGFIPVRIIALDTITLYKSTRLGAVEKYDEGKPVRSIVMTKETLNTMPDVEELFGKQLISMPKLHAQSIKEILIEFRDVFSRSQMDIGCVSGVEHRILTGNAPPIALNPRRTPLALEDKIDDLVDQLVQQDIIRPSQSPWNAPIVVVKKKTGEIRMCVDYRRLNSVTSRPVFPIPDPVHLFDTLGGAKYFSSLDLAQGYYQVPLAQEDIPKTAFTTRKGQFEFLRMPFGLCSAPGTFQRLMHQILRNENWNQCLIYLDDILIFGRTLEEHCSRLRTVLQRFREAGVKLSPKKCMFLQEEVEYLGHVITKDGIKASYSKIEKIRKWPIPKNAEEVRSFLGLCGYYRRLIKNYSALVAPLEKLCLESWTKSKKKKVNTVFEWTVNCNYAFENLKDALTSAPVLAFPTSQGEYVLDTDASHSSVGAVLSQLQDGTEHVIAYASHKLTQAERNYCVTRKELLSVYKYVKHFSHYLYGKRFKIRTDHKALTWLLNWDNPTTSQYHTWIAELSEYDFTIEHRPGKKHTNADALSRLPQCEQCELEHHDPKKKRNVKNIRDNELFVTFRSMSRPNSGQEDDKDIQIVLREMKAGKLHEKHPKELQDASRNAKILWERRNDLRIRNNQLYLSNKDKYAWVVPSNERKRIIMSTHKGNGHIGITKTIALLKERFYWPNMEMDTRHILNVCKPCQERKAMGARKMPSPQISLTGHPFEKIALDITGPLRVSRGGERYILGIIDYFTKFPMLLPLHNTESKTVAKALFDNWICIFGAPMVIHSDRGTSFESSLFYELCYLCGIKKTKTAPYYPKSDGLIERLFGTVKDMIYASISGSSNDWKDVLPIISMGLRCTIQRSTGVSPYEALFGSTMRTPLSWNYPDGELTSTDQIQLSKSGKIVVNEHIIELQHKLADIHERMKALKRKTMAKVSFRDNDTGGFPIGTKVMARVLPVVKGIDKARFTGPYIITSQLGICTYRLQHCHTGEAIERNIHHIKKISRSKYSETSKGISTNTDQLTNEKERKRIRLAPQRYGFNST
jgi:hypothetical protein